MVVGGRVMTGSAAAGMEQSFIDNMSMEYRLDRAGTHYLRLFHNKNYENFLEGEVIETGIGYVLRRRLDSPKDLFRFRPTDRCRRHWTISPHLRSWSTKIRSCGNLVAAGRQRRSEP